MHISMLTYFPTECFLDKVVDKGLEFRLRETDVQVFWPVGVGSDEGKRHLRGGKSVKLSLSLLSSLSESN